MNKNTKLRLAALVLLGVVVGMWLRACAMTFGWTFNPALILLAAAVAVFLCWWAFSSWRLGRFCKRLDRAGVAYLSTQDGETYLQELDACGRMPGIKKAAISGMPAQDFLVVLKIRTLREMDRREDARALLKTARQQLTGETARQLLDAEEKQLKSTV